MIPVLQTATRITLTHRRKFSAMKKTGQCVKCGSSDLIRIPGRLRSYGGGGNYIVAGTTMIAPIVPVTRFLCAQCGYSEEWVESASEIEKLREAYKSAESK
jgi:predicted nucleic-acid-binding Zn-ribbon protein